jgi:transglutaminase/protease-like cytokinesis protein 3
MVDGGWWIVNRRAKRTQMSKWQFEHQANLTSGRFNGMIRTNFSREVSDGSEKNNQKIHSVDDDSGVHVVQHRRMGGGKSGGAETRL